MEKIKKYLTVIFVMLSLIILFVGYRSTVRGAGIVTWGLVLICLIIAAYFTKYIPDPKEEKD